MSYDWVTTEMFEKKLEELVGEMSAAQIMAVPGVADALREELNNAVLAALEEERPLDPRDESRWPEPEEEEPDDATLEAWVYDSIVEATDGCTVEPDGMCEHGHPSWLLRMGLI